MRKITIVLVLFLNLFAGHAQNATMRIYELVNSSNWFTLAKEYPQLKDSIQYDFVRLMAEAMIAQNFNREDEATEMFRTLINSHQQQIGSNAALSLTEIILSNYERSGMYELAAEKAYNLIEQTVKNAQVWTKPQQRYRPTSVCRSNRYKGLLTVLLDSGAETGFSYHYFTKHRNELSQLRGTKEIVGGTVDGFHSTMALHVPSVKFSVCNQELEMKDVYVPYMKGSSPDWHDIALG